MLRGPSVVAGLPEAVTDVLCAVRVLGAGPHELLGHAGAQCVPLHPVVHLRGAHGSRCAPQSLHRYSREPHAPRPHPHPHANYIVTLYQNTMLYLNNTQFYLFILLLGNIFENSHIRKDTQSKIMLRYFLGYLFFIPRGTF